MKACELIENNSDITAKEIIEELENLRSSVRLYFLPDTLEYLQRSGRASLDYCNNWSDFKYKTFIYS